MNNATYNNSPSLTINAFGDKHPGTACNLYPNGFWVSTRNLNTTIEINVKYKNGLIQDANLKIYRNNYHGESSLIINKTLPIKEAVKLALTHLE